MTTTERIALAVGIAWGDFAARHPNQAAAVAALDDFPTLLCAEIERDAAYAALVEQTDAETNVANLVAAVGPLILNAVITLLG